jgi:hypothetical protein
MGVVVLLIGLARFIPVIWPRRYVPRISADAENATGFEDKEMPDRQKRQAEKSRCFPPCRPTVVGIYPPKGLASPDGR